MRKSILVYSMYLIVIGLIACSKDPNAILQITSPIPLTSPKSKQLTMTPTLIPQPTTEVSSEPAPYPEFTLGERGHYFVGVTTITLVDESRDGRKFKVQIWYPASEETDDTSMKDALPDRQNGPFPLILTGNDTGFVLFKEHLATHGFVMAEVSYPENYDTWDAGIIDHPLDMLFTLEKLASSPPEGFDGVIDTARVGVTGYSWEGFYTLMLSGVQIDPEFYLAYCAKTKDMQPLLEDSYQRYICSLSEKWGDFVPKVGEKITSSDNGLWQSITDDRILAFMPMAADGAWLYGERGLAAADRPMLFIQATEDSPYQPTEAYFIFENLGTADKSMISFVGKGHMMVFQPQVQTKIKHFAVAFFGYHLQERKDYAYYFSEEFVTQFDDLAWGVYTGE